MTPRPRAWIRAGFLLYAVALFIATHWPSLRIESAHVPRPDLFAHVAAFGLWTLLCLACGWFGAALSRRNVLTSALLAMAYGVFDETTQGVPALNRHVSLSDAGANTLGVVAAAGLAMLVSLAARRSQNQTMRQADDLGAGVRTVSGLTLASRVLGLARDVLTARIFADTALGSAFAAALAIPNVFRRLFGEGAISAAFIPSYTRLLRSDERTAAALASVTAGGVAIATGAIMLIGELVLAILLYALPHDPERAQSLTLIMITLPFMPLICTAAILGGMLQVRGRFGPWAAAPIILNLCMIAAAAPFFFIDAASAPRWAVLIGVAVVVSGAIQVAWSMLALRGAGIWSLDFAPARAEARAVLTRAAPALIGLGTLQLNTLLDTLIAMWPNWVGPTIAGAAYPLDTASNSVLFYAQRLYQFPLGVFGIAVATVVFPELSRRSGDAAGFADTLRRGLRLSFFIGLPASLGLAIVGEDLAAVVLGGLGRGFSADGVTRASAVLFGYAFGVWVFSLNQVLVRAFYARGDTRTPMRIAIAAVGLNLALNITLIWPLREAGLAWSTTISATVQLLALLLILRRTEDAPLFDRGAVFSGLRTLTLALFMAAAALIAHRLLTDAALPWVDRLIRLAIVVLTGGAVFVIGAAISRAPELRWLVRTGPRS